MKHAYMIIAHNNFSVLEKLLLSLDDARNDIFVHVDKKSKDFDAQRLNTCVTRASLVFVPRRNVNWGGYSMVEAEMQLLEAAAKTEHRYYHLLSGADMPLKSQDEIHAFFTQSVNKNYIDISSNENVAAQLEERALYYRFLQEKIGRGDSGRRAAYGVLEGISLRIQKTLKVSRVQDIKTLHKGGQWFSITHDLALYLLQERREIKKRFRYTLCPDEMFLQTMVMHSPFAQTVEKNSLRCIDWKRGTPYGFRETDFDFLMNSGKLFARKFDEHTDMNIVEKIADALKQKT